MAAVIASHGYFVALPNLYYREVPSFELDFDSQESRAEMTRLTRTVGNRMVVRDVGALFEFARSHPAARVGDVGLVGYCMSGPFALYSAAEYPDSVRAAASFYGVRLHVESVDSPHHRLSEVIGEIYVAAAEHDPYVPMDMVERFETARAAAGTRGQVEVYWGTHHGFAFDDRPTYDPVADDRHWKELLSLFDRNLHSFRD
jgi:carboxymethylenebutenolidase